MIDIVFDMHFISSIRINVVKLCHIQKDTSQDLSQFMTGMGSMKATLYNDIREIHVQEVEYVPPGPGYLTLDTRCTGICGSNLHNYFGQWKPDLAVAQGHEVCGEVAEIGKGVTGFRVGDLVTLECFSHCGDCLYCRKGWYNHCLNRSWFAPGGPRRLCGICDGSCLQCLSIGRHDIRRGHACGATGRLEMAERFGADLTIDIADVPDPDERKRVVLENTPQGWR